MFNFCLGSWQVLALPRMSKLQLQNEGKVMNTYTELIAKALKIDVESASKVQRFMECWFDDFRFGSSTERQIIRAAKEAQAMMADPRFADVVAYEVK
jgi:hypothetical protein